MNNPLIVVVEDEQAIQDVIAYNLRREGYEVLLAGHGNEGLALIQSKRPALVILDLMLPGIDGLSICQQLRADAKTRSIPLMILSAKEEESDIVIGLSLGADDYLAKPFSPREMLARVKALLRRANNSRSVADDYIQVGPLAIDFSRFEAKLSGQPLKLTATEFKLLAELAGHPGRALTREHLLNRAVGDAVVVVDRNIDVHIRSVRKKLGDHAGMIETVRGLGYRFVE
ncbi:MAG: DNA-binding response regulator [Gammaproteobacteria bacterium]|nr:DNA-binding response regulator [Gammaproteobacteria bacterium]|tara:strand:+ start:772 stop:1458 length:687 start_codon:yes stop_codon:yes gene_type:complete